MRLNLFVLYVVVLQLYLLLPVLFPPAAEIMSILYNFVKVDTPTFLSNPSNVEVMVSMCRTIISGDHCEDSQEHACKLLEVILLQCRGNIDNVSLQHRSL